MNRRDAIGDIIERHPGAAVVFGNGLQSRVAAAYHDRPGHLYLLHAMGEAYSVGAGLKAARPDLEVVVVEGDGGTIMGLAGLTVAPAVGGLTYYTLCNGVYETTGGTATPFCNWGPEWMWVVEIERGVEPTPDPPDPAFILRRFRAWLDNPG